MTGFLNSGMPFDAIPGNGFRVEFNADAGFDGEMQVTIFNMLFRHRQLRAPRDLTPGIFEDEKSRACRHHVGACSQLYRTIGSVGSHRHA